MVELAEVELIVLGMKVAEIVELVLVVELAQF